MMTPPPSVMKTRTPHRRLMIAVRLLPTIPEVHRHLRMTVGRRLLRPAMIAALQARLHRSTNGSYGRELPDHRI